MGRPIWNQTNMIIELWMLLLLLVIEILKISEMINQLCFVYANISQAFDESISTKPECGKHIVGCNRSFVVSFCFLLSDFFFLLAFVSKNVHAKWKSARIIIVNCFFFHFLHFSSGVISVVTFPPLTKQLKYQNSYKMTSYLISFICDAMSRNYAKNQWLR